MKSIRERAVRKKRRHGATLFACFVAALFFYAGGITAFADAEGTVIPSSAKVRSSADVSSESIGSVKQNEKVIITGKTTGADGQTWYQVVSGGTKGFIRADLVDVAGESAVQAAGPTVTNTDADVSPAEISAGTINSSSVNIRKGPATTDAVVASAKQGTQLSITGQTTGADGQTWYQVSLSSGGGTVTGFVRSNLVDPSTDTGDGAGEGAEGMEGAEGNPGEEGTEAGMEGGEPQDAGQASADSFTKLNNVVSSRILPEDADLSEMQIDASKLAEWESGQYYVLYTNSSDGTDQWYLYDMSQGSCMKIANPTAKDSEDGNADGFGKNTKIILIVMAVVILALVITVTILILKLRDAELEDDDEDDDEDDEDDDEDDEDDDEDDDDDDEDEDDDEIKGGRSGRVNSRAWRPRNFLHAADDDEDDEEDEDEDEDEEDEEEEEPVRPVRRKKPQPVKKPAAKPQQKARRTEREEPRQPQKPKKPAPKPAYYEDDEDDEFEFEFLNMDGKDDFS